MEKQIVTALIATRSIPLADGLEALLTSLPQIDQVSIARTFETAFQQIATRKPTIVLLDITLFDHEPEARLEEILVVSPKTQRVLLVDGVQQVNFLPKRAEAVLIKGTAPATIAGIVTKLLLVKGD